MTRTARTVGVSFMMMTLLSGWSGRAMAGPAVAPGVQVAPAATAPSDTIQYQVQATSDGALALVASSADVTLRKSVRSDGTTSVVIERAGDAVSIDTTAVSVRVRRGSESVSISVNALGEEETGKVQRLLAGSAAIRGLRAVVGALEGRGALDQNALAVRLTGALIGQLDGDPGAIPRLARELDAKFGTGVRRVRRQQTDCIQAYAWAVTKASWDLQACYSYYGYWNPLRELCSFYWALTVESAWFQFLSCSSFPVK